MPQMTLRSIPEYISDVRRTYPQSVALSHGHQQFTYEQLDDKARRFAAHLTQLGVGPGSSVALCFERCFDWIVVALAIMRSGAAYVPLDPTWPDSRLRFVIEDSGANVLVARAALLDRLRCRANGVDPFRDAAVIANAPARERVPIQSDSLAYVIYTSGSTGAPKGVQITHANLSHLVCWHSDTFEVNRYDRASHLMGLGFDAAVLEIWGHLCAGASLCLPIDDAIRSSPELIQQWIVREHVTIGLVPTIIGSRLITMSWPVETALRLLVIGGEALRHGPAANLPFKVVNHYGPTECTVVSTFAELAPENAKAPPIGRPIAGASIYLLDNDGDLVPDGTVGEIYVGGSGVGRGYGNRPDLTEHGFLPDRFSPTPGARMYRTGDRGIRRPDGQIEFRGRLDRQVKIHGQRIELDEIAEVLNHHPAIDFATVVALTTRDGENQLVAYVLPKSSASLTKEALQNHLLDRLPAYMVPSTFVRLGTVPLNSNGKIDVTSLHLSATGELFNGVSAPPVSVTEARLLAMVRDLLANDSIYGEDSFFLAGGHSLLGMQLILRVRELFGVDVTLRQLFEAPSVSRLSVVVQRMLDHSTETKRAMNPIFWVQSRALDFAKMFGDDQPLFCVALDVDDFQSLGKHPTVPEIAARLVRKIRETQPIGPYNISGYSLGGLVAYEIAYQLKNAGEDISLLALLDAPCPGFLNLRKSWGSKFRYLRYLLTRARDLGPGLTARYASERLAKNLWSFLRIGEKSAHQLTEAAAHTYQCPKYDGDVLLLLASEGPTHLELAAAWRALVSGELDVHYIRAYHRDFLKTENAVNIARAIVSHIPLNSAHQHSTYWASTSQTTNHSCLLAAK